MSCDEAVNTLLFLAVKVVLQHFAEAAGLGGRGHWWWALNTLASLVALVGLLGVAELVVEVKVALALNTLPSLAALNTFGGAWWEWCHTVWANKL